MSNKVPGRPSPAVAPRLSHGASPKSREPGQPTALSKRRLEGLGALPVKVPSRARARSPRQPRRVSVREDSARSASRSSERLVGDATWRESRSVRAGGCVRRPRPRAGRRAQPCPLRHTFGTHRAQYVTGGPHTEPPLPERSKDGCGLRTSPCAFKRSVGGHRLRTQFGRPSYFLSTGPPPRTRSSGRRV